MWTGDNLDILRGLNDNCIDLVYADPPFNSNKNYEAPIGSKAAGAAFKDTWTLSDVDLAEHGEIADREPRVYSAIETAGVVHSKGMKSYLIMMAVRLLEIRRVLKPSGSVYLHCDPTAEAYLRILCDAVFGKAGFLNAITWSYRRWPNKTRRYQRMHDTLLFYSCTPGEHTFNVDHEPPAESTMRVWRGQKQKLAPGATAKTVDGTPSAGLPQRDVFNIGFVAPRAKERTGYPTQKPLALLDRIIKASSNPGDVVLDPFCGCATACVSAESLHRKWIGIDLSPVAATLVESRLRDQLKMFGEVHHRTDIPQRTDLGELPNYRTHKHFLYGRQEGHCNGCRMAFPFRNYEVDHIVPRNKGGSDHVGNLQLLCGACNRAKGTGTQAELVAKLKDRGQLAA